MSKKRELLFTVLTIVLLGAILYTSWYEPRSLQRENTALPVERQFSLEERALDLQSRILLGYHYFAQQATAPSTLAAGAIRTAIDHMASTEGPQLSADPATGRFITRKKAVFAYVFGLPERAREVFQQVQGTKTPEEVRLDELLSSYLASCPTVEPSSADIEFVVQELDWFGRVLFSSACFAEARALFEPEVKEQARSSFERVLKATFVGLLAACISAVLFGTFLYRLFTSRVRLQFEQAAMPPGYALEIFAIYLAGMLAAPRLAHFLSAQGVSTNILLLNCIGICCLMLILAWPLFWGVRWRNVRQTIGLVSGGFVKLLGDIVVAPLSYLGSWSLLGVILLLYSLILSQSGVDISQGTHPIVPILVQAQNPQSRLLIIVLAVIVAPIVEEIMFRGALYAWLRTYCSATIAILSSAFIFAAIHPQGPLGIVPLMCIGAILAFLREWRGNLLPAMIVHACFNGGTILLLLSLFS